MVVKIIHIDICRHAVVRQVAMETAYVAVKSEHASLLADRVPVVEADEALMLSFWSQSCAVLDLLFSGFLLPRPPSPPVTEDAAYRAALRLPDFFDFSVVDALRQQAFAFLVADMVARWMAMAFPERADGCRQLVAECKEHLRLLLNRRYLPPRGRRARKRMEIL